MKTCENCKFQGGFGPPQDQDVTHFVEFVRCRRRAPVITGGMMSATMTIWPQVHKNGWCGEYEPPDEIIPEGDVIRDGDRHYAKDFLS
ncbi:MAG: hypothetical protein IPK75_12555 [Acidobacteria bacterium]|nr:hypothetical protein [Acidobacteriota bacterium]